MKSKNPAIEKVRSRIGWRAWEMIGPELRDALVCAELVSIVCFAADIQGQSNEALTRLAMDIRATRQAIEED